MGLRETVFEKWLALGGGVGRLWMDRNMSRLSTGDQSCLHLIQQRLVNMLYFRRHTHYGEVEAVRQYRVVRRESRLVSGDLQAVLNKIPNTVDWVLLRDACVVALALGLGIRRSDWAGLTIARTRALKSSSNSSPAWAWEVVGRWLAVRAGLPHYRMDSLLLCKRTGLPITSQDRLCQRVARQYGINIKSLTLAYHTMKGRRVVVDEVLRNKSRTVEGLASRYNTALDDAYWAGLVNEPPIKLKALRRQFCRIGKKESY